MQNFMPPLTECREYETNPAHLFTARACRDYAEINIYQEKTISKTLLTTRPMNAPDWTV